MQKRWVCNDTEDQTTVSRDYGQAIWMRTEKTTRLRIPVSIVHDDSICGLKIEANTTSSNTQQEYEDVRLCRAAT